MIQPTSNETLKGIATAMSKHSADNATRIAELKREISLLAEEGQIEYIAALTRALMLSEDVAQQADVYGAGWAQEATTIAIALTHLVERLQRISAKQDRPAGVDVRA